MKLVYWYKLYKNGEFVEEGTGSTLCEIVGCTPGTIYKKAKNHEIYNGYSLEIVDRRAVPYTPPPKREANPKRLEYLMEHLLRYGNTISRLDPEQYIPALNEAGIYVQVKEIKEKKKLGRPSVHWLIERTK